MGKDFGARHAEGLIEYATRKAFALAPVVGNDWVQGGNSFGVAGILGTNDNNSLSIITNGSGAVQFDTSTPKNALFGTTHIEAGVGNVLTIGGSTTFTTTVNVGLATGVMAVNLGTGPGVKTVRIGNVTAGTNLSITNTLTQGGGGGSVSLLSSGVGLLNIGDGVSFNQVIQTVKGLGFAIVSNNLLDNIGANGIAVTAGSNASAGALMMLFNRPDGTTIGSIAQASATTVAFNTTSDKRMKTDIVRYEHGLDLLSQISVYEFAFKADPNNVRHRHVGFLAQELYEVWPEAVTPAPAHDEERAWGVDYGKLTPLLVKAVQDLAAQVNALTAKVAELSR
jgi:hypothetical protein